MTGSSPEDAGGSPATDAASQSTRGRAEASQTDETAGGLARWRSREVEVPMRVYKTVTVFATLIAVVAVLVGFVLIDTATNRAQLALSDVDALVALAGVGSIVFGAAVYAFSTRFRAAGMGKPNSDADEGDGNG